ncbi:TPA: hypothetical protein DCE37_06845 [Candidatus Latescibacteria bacterium]|nr:hypothetical protein [Candidatus Latescibacterota bacterium]
MTKERLIFGLAFVMDGCFGLVGLSVPLLAVELGATYDDLGLIGATGAAAYTICCLATGGLLKRWPHQRTAALSAGGVLLCLFSYTLARNVIHIAMVAGAIGLSLSAFWPTLQSWLAEGHDRARLIRILGTFNICWGAGMMIGPALGGRLYTSDPHLPFQIAAGIVFCVFALLVLARPSSPPDEPADIAPISGVDRRFLTISWIANFATFFSTGLVRSLFPKYATDSGIDPALLGNLMGLIGLAQIVSFYLISRTQWWENRLAPMVCVQVFGAGGLFLMSIADGVWLFAASLCSVGLLIGATFTWSMFYSLRSPSESRARAGIHEAIVGSGFLFGPLLGGLAAEHLGASTPYRLGAATILLGAVVATIIIRRQVTHPAVQPTND